MERRLEILGGALQNNIAKSNELEIVLSSLIKLVEELPGYAEAKEKIVEQNKKLLDESSELDTE